MNKPKGKQVQASPIPPEILKKLPPEILENLPPDIKAVIEQKGGFKLTTEMSMATFRSPWLPASVLAEYDHYFPGWGTRMLELTEKQVSHRHELERKQVDRAESRMDRGQTFGFSVAGISIVAAAMISIAAPPYWFTSVAALGLVIVGVGGPAVARILATKFNWPSSKTDSEKP